MPSGWMGDAETRGFEQDVQDETDGQDEEELGPGRVRKVLN